MNSSLRPLRGILAGPRTSVSTNPFVLQCSKSNHIRWHVLYVCAVADVDVLVWIFHPRMEPTQTASVFDNSCKPASPFVAHARNEHHITYNRVVCACSCPYLIFEMLLLTSIVRHWIVIKYCHYCFKLHELSQTRKTHLISTTILVFIKIRKCPLSIPKELQQWFKTSQAEQLVFPVLLLSQFWSYTRGLLTIMLSAACAQTSASWIKRSMQTNCKDAHGCLQNFTICANNKLHGSSLQHHNMWETLYRLKQINTFTFIYCIYFKHMHSNRMCLYKKHLSINVHVCIWVCK